MNRKEEINLRHQFILNNSMAVEKLLAPTIANNPMRQVYHVMPPLNWMNDPCAMVFLRDIIICSISTIPIISPPEACILVMQEVLIWLTGSRCPSPWDPAIPGKCIPMTDRERISEFLPAVKSFL